MKIFYGSLLLFHSFVGLICFTFYEGRHGTRHATFERFDNTCGGKKTPIIFNYTGLRSDGNKVWLNCTITVKEDILINPKMTMSLDRCKSNENLDSCEQFYAFKEDNYCAMLEKHSPLWDPFFSSFEPKWKCPFKKGIYRGTNNMLDASAFLLFPVDNWVWKLNIEVRNPETERLLTCLIIQTHVVMEKN